MKSLLLQATTLAAVLLTAPFALSAEDTKPKARKAGPFAAADANQDGKLDPAEFATMTKQGASPDAAKKRFARLDTNQDGFLSREELQAGRKQGEKPHQSPENDRRKAKQTD
jgi:Ca2+-binding EF-hand superfamily protein